MTLLPHAGGGGVGESSSWPTPTRLRAGRPPSPRRPWGFLQPCVATVPWARGSLAAQKGGLSRKLREEAGTHSCTQVYVACGVHSCVPCAHVHAQNQWGPVPKPVSSVQSHPAEAPGTPLWEKRNATVYMWAEPLVVPSSGPCWPLPSSAALPIAARPPSPVTVALGWPAPRRSPGWACLWEHGASLPTS